MVADFLEETLVDAGYGVCGIARTLAEAIALNEQHHPDLSVIDIRLSNGEHGTEVAAALRQRSRLGVLYATGNPYHPLLDHAEGEGCISKPYLGCNIVSALGVISEKMSNRPLSAFPQGFRLLDAPLVSYAA